MIALALHLRKPLLDARKLYASNSRALALAHLIAIDTNDALREVMPRKVHLMQHLSQQQLRQRYRQSRDLVESKRWHLLWLVSMYGSIKQAAAAAKLNYDYAREIVATYNQMGEAGIENRSKSRPSCGRSTLLTPAQTQLLCQTLAKPPADGGTWNGPKVARWIEKQTGRKRVWNQRGWEYLQRCGNTARSTVHSLSLARTSARLPSFFY